MDLTPWFSPADNWTRKQRCGGFTDGIKCRPCTARKVRCSFQDEVKDLRYNPYIQVRHSRPSPIRGGKGLTENTSLSSYSVAFPSIVTEFQGGELNPPLPEFSSGELNGTPVGEELPKQLNSLKSRFVLIPWKEADQFLLTIWVELRT